MIRPGTLVIAVQFLLYPFPARGGNPPESSIPVIVWAHGFHDGIHDINSSLYRMLSNRHFHGLLMEYFHGEEILDHVVLPADTTGMLTVINPHEIASLTAWYARGPHDFHGDSAYIRPAWEGYDRIPGVFPGDTILEAHSARGFRDDVIMGAARAMRELFTESSRSVWFYLSYDEAPSWQWNRMLCRSSSYDDLIPDLFYPGSHRVWRDDLDPPDSVCQPVFNTVNPEGVLSWVRWHISAEDSTKEQSFVIANMHTLNDWAGYSNSAPSHRHYPPPGYGTQADVVRALFSMEYQGYGYPVLPDPLPNHPEFILYDLYPFRHAGTDYQATAPYSPSLGSPLENRLLDHFDLGLDSTFVVAWNISRREDRKASVFLVAQAFGRAGGEVMWNGDTLSYQSYNYRIPAPQELRMFLNQGLLMQARALFTYCLSSYGNNHRRNAGLLDENRIPFDAPFEEWAYRGRPESDFFYVPPDLIPPFMDGYDPLHPLTPRPVLVPGWERNRENYLTWKFAPYGRLWNSMKDILGSVARVAPELAGLSWWEGREDRASISINAGHRIPVWFRPPRIRVFTDTLRQSCYVFYLNRHCRENGVPFEIGVSSEDFPPETPFSEYALDHHRRVLIRGKRTGPHTFVFPDTLDAGEARLVQFFHGSRGLPADVRITAPDLTVILPARSDTLTDYRSPAGETVHVNARFYNMGTEEVRNVGVFLINETTGERIDSTTLDFTGLDIDLCYTPDDRKAVFQWTPGPEEIGIAILRVVAGTWPGEPDPSDNTATLVYRVEPRDYATEVRGDPWNMAEAGEQAPEWFTHDIVQATGWSLFTDSISGMFEGALAVPEASGMYRGDLELALTDSIDAEVYGLLSMGMVGYNPLSDEPDACAVFISTDSVNWVNLGFGPGNGWNRWTVTDPVDLAELDGLQWSGKAGRLWLRFQCARPDPEPADPLQPVPIRIGWIRLTERRPTEP